VVSNDLAPLALLFAPLASALANELGAYDGFAAFVTNAVLWGIPWLMGRLYVGTPQGRRDLLRSLVIGSLFYVPLCLIEMRMSPQLHRWVYGSAPFDFITTYRFGGWRPVGFMHHGIELGTLMMCGGLIATWTWYAKSQLRIARLPVSWIAILLLVMLGSIRAMGAWILALLGFAILLGTKLLRTRTLLVATALFPFGYVAARTADILPTRSAVDAISTVSADRAQSLATRLHQEELLFTRAMARPWLGWGGWGRSRIHDEFGRDTSLTDGLWIILFGQNGFIGLASWMAMMLGPSLSLLYRGRRSRIAALTQSSTLPVMVLVELQMIDWIMNGFINSVVVMLSASLVGATVEQGRARSRVRRREIAHANTSISKDARR
jgi:hypothetical protein